MPEANEELEDARSDIRDIDDLLERFQSAVVSGELPTLETFFASEAVSVFTGRGGIVRGRDAIVETWTRHMSAWDDVTVARSDTFVRIHGDTAWATFLWTGSGVADGVRYLVEGERWSVVLLWEDGWRFAQTHSSLPFSDWQSLDKSNA